MTKQLDLYGKTVYRLVDPTWEGRAEELKKQGYAEIPRSRSSDPITSHEAEAHLRSTGRLGRLQDLVLDLLRQNPGSTARELDSRFILDGVAHRRLIELERKGLVVRGEPRTSKWHDRRAITWRAK
jgi:hypothetical protein